MASLAALIARLPASTQAAGDVHREVTSIEIDSRAVRPGALFVALRGQHGDGHTFLAQALAAGAVAVLVDEGYAAPPDVCVVHVPDTRAALSPLAAAFYGDPSHGLDVIGVTGTNGKTTTTRMISAILTGAGRPCGVIGTVGAEFGDRSWTLANTTPQPPELHELLAAMRDGGAKAVAMEVSSHALALGRVEDVRFRAGVLTNVTRDHLDFHGSLEAYALAKRRLFRMVPSAVMNVDDAYGAHWATELAAHDVKVVSYGTHHDANLVPQDIVTRADGSSFSVLGQKYDIHLPGRFNIWNALAAIGVGRTLGVADAQIAGGLARLERVPGRMEHVRSGEIDVVVDYAHTPDALENALRALRETTRGALAVVFGCGGDRDRGKRPQMGAAAA
ncbi:MAG TPA: UDP-N-acetylmuramoyl-L-alanyl-D-glutamate--2,6-diaminopimelate ligase, partial [Candidatus Lustribacter sp.]|nr:UDP-N-acetylmuramoyl-L-alanyl-D-glutamate--2,6-diaminopimelate ligase [Candidatus Lustribacter sp.]